MADAMRQVRAELGDEALILSSRRVGDGVEVTAGLEVVDEVPPAPALRPMPPPAPERARQHQPLPSPQGAALAFHGASPALQRKLQAGPLAFALCAVFRFSRLALAPGGRPLLLTGPPGAGKTLSTVRLATRLVMAGTRPMVITADGQRAGATEQLAAFTRLLGIDLLVASQPGALQRALERRQEGAPVLVDAPGCDAFDRAQCDSLAAWPPVWMPRPPWCCRPAWTPARRPMSPPCMPDLAPPCWSPPAWMPPGGWAACWPRPRPGWPSPRPASARVPPTAWCPSRLSCWPSG